MQEIDLNSKHFIVEIKSLKDQITDLNS